jgi:SAM-dependent methyltransferase
VVPSHDTEVNAFERWRWNDPYWSSTWPKREELTSSVTDSLVAALALSNGDRVVDVGSGAGAASLRAARMVGPSGTVVGADISVPLVKLATERAATSDVRNATFVVCDVQQDPIPGAPFTVVMSQFGVMFFDEPVAAFGALRSQVVAGGRLGFACWSFPQDNPWFIGPALRGFVAPPAPPAPGKHATGPFAFSDVTETDSLLTDAGWTDVTSVTHHGRATVDRRAIADEGQAAFMGVPEDRLTEAASAIDAHLAPFRSDGGRYDVPISWRTVTASAP